MSLTLSDIESLTAGRFGVVDVPCPICGPEKRGSASQRRRVLRIWQSEESFATFKCARCELQGYARSNVEGGGIRADEPRPRKIITPDQDSGKQRDKARWLWGRRQPIDGSIAEQYLREARGYAGPLPRTIGFLPESGDRPACMISAVGMPIEIEPGVVGVDQVAAVHLTKLTTNGMAKAGTDVDKIMLGSPRGMPIAVATVNDGLGLIIAEGIEDALSAAEATGLGAWAAGSAPFLPYLADCVPAYVECVTCIVDDDKAGRRKSTELAERLEDRGFEVRLFYPARARSIAA
jgi:hypothetical protein